MDSFKVIRSKKPFTIIPNIIFELNLDPMSFMVYAILKRRSDEEGEVVISNQELADEIGLRLPSLRKIKKTLSSDFPRIQGPLIEVYPRYFSDGGRDIDLIVIKSVWYENESVTKPFGHGGVL